MQKKIKVLAPLVLLVLIVVLAAHYFHTHTVAVLEPRGIIAQKERNLIFFALGLAVIVVIPVFILLFGFAWRYRETNVRAKYSPNLSGSRAAETVWWIIPTVLILILSVVTWNSSHALDPYKPIASNVMPLQVQVIALDWKWLFIYPMQNVASVNKLYIPVNTPVDFSLTSDAPMNSFWIPQLGGQIYTMPGMSTQLHLMASQAGQYYGESANISGAGFAGMNFTADAMSNNQFNNWVQEAQHSSYTLSQSAYTALAKPSENNTAVSYASVVDNLYDNTVMKYNVPGDVNTAQYVGATK